MGATMTSQVSDDQGGSERLAGLIETNGDLQAGDSGGPLLNAAGKVIGMDTAASVGGYGLQQIATGDGYTIPINKAISIAKQITGGKASATVHVGATAFLGVEVTSNGYDGSGALLAAVVPGSPAAAAGLVPGDLITTFAGHAISTPSGLTAVVMAEKPGTRVVVTHADQNGQSNTTSLTVGSGPPQ
ncbi:MAG TPA: PDZ domain-containing protein [Gaiellaceae bacterium]|nr:PDZ domain-containing protein [Gaiellaceae bacterium]